MPTFSHSSLLRLALADDKLATLFNKVIETRDCSILCSFRDQQSQDKEFAAGRSKKHWPNSLHNRIPSLAVDVAPYPQSDDRQESERRYYFFAGYVFAVAAELGLKIRWGGDWNGNGDFADNLFDDLGHFEILEDLDGHQAVKP